MSSVWDKGRPTRVPVEILKQSHIGKKCADSACRFIHSDLKRMFLCKGAALPVGTGNADIKVIEAALTEKGLNLSDGCDIKENIGYYIFIIYNYKFVYL